MKPKPSEFYKSLRPEYFSDSKTTYKLQLTTEVLAFELENISKNQKQDQFEVLARRFAEKFVTPNLIPQVGPSGGGDGKTDSETYPVSDSILSRWFIPTNAWTKDESWAFAISSKKEWKSKLKSDIKSILSTNRPYTKIFFITNQRIPSKQRKESQDSLSNEFKIDVIILDGEWIIEKTLGNNLQDLVAESLNLSDIYKSKETVKGKNDANREKIMSELEIKIATPNRYFEVDFQLVEDCLDLAIYSRGIEESRETIEGKFSRALRFGEKLNNQNQLGRIYYQQAWTSLFWFNDFESFIMHFSNFRETVDENSNISVIKDYSTLITVLKSHKEFESLINIENEKSLFYKSLEKRINNTERLSTSLEAESYFQLHTIFDNAYAKKDCEHNFSRFSEIILAIRGHLGYPFEQIYRSILTFGKIFPESKAYDLLVDVLASANEERHSELAASETFVDRAIQKYEAKLYQQSIIYLGKSVSKLAKEESESTLILCLRILSDCYRNLGLVWASHNCLIFAASLSLKSYFREGYVENKTYDISLALAKNEILLGRLPSFLCVCELISVLSKQMQIEANEDRDNTIEFLDISFANRLLTFTDDDPLIESLPDILSNLELEFSADSILFKLGYTDYVIASVGTPEFDEDKLIDFISSIASQPIKDQLLYKTNFVDKENISLNSKVLGTLVSITFTKNKSLFLIAESLLAFFEGFLATSFENIMPTSELIQFDLKENSQSQLINLVEQNSSNKFTLEVNTNNFFKTEYRDNLWQETLKLLAVVLQKNFMFQDIKTYLDNLFNKEEVFQRVSMSFNQQVFAKDFYGNDPKIFLSDWLKPASTKLYPNKREDKSLPIYTNKFDDKTKTVRNLKDDFTPHNLRNVHSVIDFSLWDEAHWKGFGFLIEQNFTLGLTIFFKDFFIGQKIFDGWIERFGNIDENEQIRIAIIKGIDSDNPAWYRVHISRKIDVNEKDGIRLVTSRFHTLTPKDSTNLNKLISVYNQQKSFTLYLSKIGLDGQLMPDFSKGIKKTELIIKNAWEVSLHDVDRVTILKGDKPIIPQNIVDAPVTEILNLKDD